MKCIPESSGEGCLCNRANSSGLFSTQFHIAWKKRRKHKNETLNYNYVLEIISSLLHCTHTIACTWFKYYHHHHHQSYYWHGYVTFSNPDTNASWPIFFKDLNTWMLSERKICEVHVHVHYAQCILKSYVHKIKHMYMYVALILVSGWMDGWRVTKNMYSTSSVTIYTSYTHKVTRFISFPFWCHSFLSLLQRP